MDDNNWNGNVAIFYEFSSWAALHQKFSKSKFRYNQQWKCHQNKDVSQSVYIQFRLTEYAKKKKYLILP